MKTSLIEPKTITRNGWDYGYMLRRDRLSKHDVDWLRRNLGNGRWFYTKEPGAFFKVLCFQEREDLLLFKLACGECDK